MEMNFSEAKKNTEFMYEISYLCQCISEDKLEVIRLVQIPKTLKGTFSTESCQT